MDESSINQEFGLQLRKVRLDKGLSQERLALDAGYHPTYISMLENGKKNPTLETIVKLANSLKCRLEELLEPFID